VNIRSTWGEGVVPLVGGFAGVMRFPGAPGLMAATMDGVGTKLHLAQTAGRLDDAAADLVYHGANDLLVHGARPLAFLDYLAQARLDPEQVLAAVRGSRVPAARSAPRCSVARPPRCRTPICPV
jgi:phosphoribosylformylglycinamidine cyclo-ligase